MSLYGYVCIRYGFYVSLLRATPAIMKFPLVNSKAFAFMKHKAHNFFIQKHTQWEKCNTSCIPGISWVCNPSTLRTRRLHTDAWRMISLDASKIAWILLTPRSHRMKSNTRLLSTVHNGKCVTVSFPLPSAGAYISV
jgi:hypothetical protein